MRKYNNILTIIISAVIASACERYIRLDFWENPEVIANGYISTADSVHTVTIIKSDSALNKFATVNSARLQCFVNGSLAGETDSLSLFATYYDTEIRKMEFKAEIKPGDDVRIAIEADGLSAEIRETVPARLPILSVDTLTVLRRDSNNSQVEKTEHRITIKDIPGENNFYRLTMEYDSKAVVEEILVDDPYGYLPEVGTTEQGHETIKFDNSQEPVLNKRIDTGDSDHNYYNNSYNIFTDAMFRGSTYSLTVLTPPYWKLPSPIFIYHPGEVSYRISRKVTVRLFSMTRDAYTYLDGLQFNDSNLSDTYLIEGISFPHNVIGGRGFITIMAASDYVLEFPDTVIDSY